MKINGRDIVLTKKEIVYQRDIYQNVYFFKDITYIKSLEQTISGQLNSKGFVAKYTLGDFVYSSQAMEKCLESARIFSNTEKTILILGQSGTGKELLAQSIHNMSER
ncbi:MAG: sigma 54-interacting transcriptional regulator, partial [Oscillospiraceae bacterium]